MHIPVSGFGRHKDDYPDAAAHQMSHGELRKPPTVTFFWQ